MKEKKYCIREDYNHREEELPLLMKMDFPVDFSQKEVYEKARLICEKEKLNTVIDYGCGNGFKLNYYFENYETIGYDFPQLIEHCSSKYQSNNKKWKSIYELDKKNVDLIICADVIEHAKNPTDVMNYFLELNPKYVVFSTPDRDSWDSNDLGPPTNIYHCREWTKAEFEEYVSNFFQIDSVELVEQAGYNYILLVCRPK